MPARRPSRNNPNPDELHELLAAIASAAAVEVRESGERLAELDGFRFEIRHRGAQTLLHLWSQDRTLVRRVLRVLESSAGHLVLEVQRFGRKKPARLEFACADALMPGGRLTREKFRARFREILVEQFPDEDVESLTAAPDLEHSFSGQYVRGVQSRGGPRGRAWAVLAVSQEEDAATIDSALSFGLLWLDWTRQRKQHAVVEGLRLFLPAQSTAAAMHRMKGLGPAARVELYELDETWRRARPIDAQDTGNRASWLVPRREIEQTLAAARGEIDRLCALLPNSSDAFDATVPSGTREVALRFRGLEFARWRDGHMSCGLPDLGLAPHATPLEELLQKLATHRHPLADDTNHPLYRAQAERWLEAMVLRDPTRVDPRLDPRHLYRQVPASLLADRGVMDLLGMTRDGRLAVIELKATEDVHLALQGLDYWLRVRAHQQQGDFQRYAYFPGMELQQAPPLLYLVAPGFRFHPATDILLRYFSPEVAVTRVGLNENWRQGLRVVFRQ